MEPFHKLEKAEQARLKIEEEIRLAEEEQARQLAEEEAWKIEVRACQEKNGPCPSRTSEDLKQIAIDLQAGRIFTNRHIPNPNDIGMVFMVLMFMDQKDQYIPESIGLVFEYYSKAMPRSINGMPMFTSMHYLNIEDTTYVFNKAKEIDNLLKTV